MSETNAVAKVPLPAAYAADIQRRKERNAIATAIKGTLWGKDASQDTIRAVSEYAYRTGIDPVRHIELLGGRIYLNADYYREKGAPLIATGVVHAPVLQHINADERLEKMIVAGGKKAAWAEEERDNRMVERIKYNVPEAAKGAVICRITLTRDGTELIGVNSVGGTSKRDPVGDAEPAKTAESRAERRAWRRLIEVQPALMPDAVKAERIAQEINETIPDAEISDTKELPLRPAVSKLGTGTIDEYGEIEQPRVKSTVVDKLDPPSDVWSKMPESEVFNPDA